MAKANIKVDNKMYIFCEGEKTEPYYLSSYIEDKVSHKTKVINIPNTRKNTPLQLVDEAINKKSSKGSIPGDEFWVVYDRESVAKITKEKHAEAWNKAKKHGINIAMSNVCFEFWILLHFEYTCSSYTSFSDLYSKSNLKSHLKAQSVSKYDKGDDELYFIICDKIGTARKNAAKVNAQILSTAPAGVTYPYELFPYTNVHELLDSIDAF
ncbi:RloB family protein [Enterobacter hormaechei]|jgi:hypothetical protein|uniref:RloB family protein n=1 Tax=Enterobacter hormaechei TaxID=158836 RepID=UPI0032DA6250